MSPHNDTLLPEYHKFEAFTYSGINYGEGLGRVIYGDMSHSAQSA